jgi:hypothetical protein
MQRKMYAAAAACINNNQNFPLFFFLPSFSEKWQKLGTNIRNRYIELVAAAAVWPYVLWRNSACNK